MSVSTHVTVWCDAPGCNYWEDHGEPSSRRARAAAGSSGWSWKQQGDKGQMLDLCPYHTARGINAPPKTPNEIMSLIMLGDLKPG